MRISTSLIVVLYFSGGYAELSAESKLAELVLDAYSANATINDGRAVSTTGEFDSALAQIARIANE